LTFEKEWRSGAYSGRHRRARRLSGRRRVREDQQPADTETDPATDPATGGGEAASADAAGAEAEAEAEDRLGPDGPRPLPEYVFAGLALEARPQNPGPGA
jgi:hypothetical protein